MKLLGHKISKSGALLFFNMVLVFVSALLVLSNIRTRNELEESRRGFYSENAYYLDNEEGTLEEILAILKKEEWKDGILYLQNLDMESDTRGIYYKGEIRKLPLISGRYLTEEETAGRERKAMVGQRYEKDIYQEDGKSCIDILGQKFEVVGILGSAQATRLDSMKWIPLSAAAELAGPEGEYVADGRTEASIENNAELLKAVMVTDPSMQTVSVFTDTGEEKAFSFPERNRNVVEKIYAAIVFSFVLNMLLAGSSWSRSRNQQIQAEKMLGFSGGEILLSLFGRYFRIAFAALGVSAAVIGAMILSHVITAVGWEEVLPAVGAILAGELAVITAGLAARIGSRKISLKRG